MGGETETIIVEIDPGHSIPQLSGVRPDRHSPDPREIASRVSVMTQRTGLCTTPSMFLRHRANPHPRVSPWRNLLLLHTREAKDLP